MSLSEADTLKRLGRGESIAAVCEAVGISRDEFGLCWDGWAARRLPAVEGFRQAAVRSQVDIERDELGIPHIYAGNDDDLFFGFGFSMGQDRLFQLDYRRRKGAGRLAEILGKDGLELDIIARTVGLRRIAEAEWPRLPDETKAVLTAFSAGINAAIQQAADNPPIEFDLLDYRPEPWTPVDCLTIECEFRWYLTGRFPVIVIPELAKRVLGEGPLYREFLLGEADEECILPEDSYPAAPHAVEPLGPPTGGPDDGIGSNNWVVSGELTESGKPMIASDPHIAFEAVSCWYQAHLCGGSFNVAGMTYIGMPAILFGRNERVAWAITNNICSQRDLYQERTAPDHPGCFLYDGRWEQSRELTETIDVRDDEPVVKTIRFSRNGPIVDEILPPPGDQTGPVSLKWLGAYEGGWLTSLLRMDRARDVAEFNEALRPWRVPTFSLMFADADGRIGFKNSGRLPLRQHPERGYRPGWDPEHQWYGLIPFEGMPGVLDPPRGWLASANNRVANDDYPYLLAGCWVRGHRAVRIRQMIEQMSSDWKLTRDDFRDMQQDKLSLRAVECVPHLLQALGEPSHARGRSAREILAAWDCGCDERAAAATIFNVFFTHWCEAVAAERFDPESRELLAAGASGIASRLLQADEFRWFENGDRVARIREAFDKTLDMLTKRFGPDMQNWEWGRLHRLPLPHPLSSRGDLADLLDYGMFPAPGDMGTLYNTGSGPEWTATSGAGYRLLAELDASPPGLWAIDLGSQSGHPGSPHYHDQMNDWRGGEYHYISLDRQKAAESIRSRQTLQPV